MLKAGLLFLLLLTVRAANSQGNFKVPFNQLKEFEGLYESDNQTNLKIAASPKDTILYALIEKSRYPLTPLGKDLFLNQQKIEVRFFRDGQHKIAGYFTHGRSYRLLDKNVSYPRNMWYPRPAGDPSYHYSVPPDLRDGLSVGSLEGTGLNPGLLSEMMQKIVAGDYPHVHSVLIIKDGRLVFEQYFYEYGIDSLQELRSATKSFISALAGIALDQHFIKSTKEKVLSFFPEYDLKNKSAAKTQITLENLLSNQSGLDCDISNAQSVGNEVTMGNTDDWVKFTLDLPLIDSTHTRGMYCSGNPVILGRIIEKVSKQSLPDFARSRLLGPLGITRFRWDFKPDRSSAETFCQLYLRPRDMAKFGLLFLDNGRWKGQPLISEEWVGQSLAPHSVVQGVDYGYFWWLKHLDADGVRYYGKGAQGNGGQRIYLWETLNLVTIITGGSYNSPSSSDELIRKYILPAFNKK